MKKLLPFITVLLLLGCKDEKDVDPANTSTFMRYFGSEHNHTAVLADEAHDGFTLLSNMEIPAEVVGDFTYKIRMIHTDLYGHEQWTKEYPGFDEATSSILDGYKASSFIAIDGGYLIIGDRINTDGYSQLQLLQIDTEGNLVQLDTLAVPTVDGARPSLHGRAVTIDETGNYVVLGQITDHPTNDMFVAKLYASDLQPEWSKQHGSASGSVLTRIYTDAQNLLWGGTLNDLRNDANGNPKSDVRLVISPQNSLASYDNPCCDPSRDETAMDFAATLGGYVFVGTAEGANGSDDIFFTKLTTAGIEIFTPEPHDFSTLNDQGVSVCAGVDGGYMILATVESGEKGFGKEDLLLYKVDDRGNATREINYGGAEKEEGASIRTTSDGSYLVFGTTYFGELKKLMLMKVNAKGEL
jgi:hypothetical protein